MPPLLHSGYATVINRNDNQRHLIRYTWIEKDSCKYVEISIKTPVFVKDIPKETNAFITFFKIIIVYRNTKAPP